MDEKAAPPSLEVARAATHSEVRSRVEEFRNHHRTSLLTLLFTDLVGSTALKQRLGDAGAVALIGAHREIVRSALNGTPQSREIETAGDSFFCVFVKPSDAVSFGLRVQAALRKELTAQGLLMRIGIHLGEVVVEERADAAKPLDLYGLQVDTAARVMSLAQGGQILCGRAVFDNARPALKGRELEGVARLVWLNHGPYVMKGVEDPVEICEVGEEGLGALIAPGPSEKARPAGMSEEELGWRPSVDGQVPNTEWRLEEKVGEGGFGEAWRAVHNSTKEKRVFKFCFLRERLQALRRELALFRLIREGIGEHPNIVRLHEVHLEGPGYFLGMEYVSGQDLRSWLVEGGRLYLMSLAAKLDIVRQVAEALEAAHRVGVIHQDVKPQNILVDDKAPPLPSGAPRVKLADFGLGKVDNEEAVRKLGLTKGGSALMRSAVAEKGSGTLLYMAPERVEGRSATTRSDVYSLGVVLFQMLAGDMDRAVTLDWEAEVGDPVLREDLWQILAGTPEKRLASAGEMAQRLGSWARRRRARVFKRVGAGAAIALAAVLATAAFFSVKLRSTQRALSDALVFRADTALGEKKVLEAMVFLAHAREHADSARVEAAALDIPAPLAVLSRILAEYRDPIEAVAFSPDCRVLAVASEDSIVILWDAASGKKLRTLDGHVHSVRAVAFSPDGRRLASGSSDDTVVLWDVASGKELHVLVGHQDTVRSVAFSPDGRVLASGSDDNTVKIWDTEDGKDLRTLIGHEGAVNSVAFSPDGRGLASGSADHTIRLWGGHMPATLAEVERFSGLTLDGFSIGPKSVGQ